MPELVEISSDEFLLHPYASWKYQNFLLTCGDFATNQYNTMTIGWGSFGRMWQKPFAMVVVRPSRFTFEFMEAFSTFTLCMLPLEFKPAISLLGTKSGRDGNKIAESGLTIVPSVRVPSPSFAEAELVIECQKTYWQDFDPTHFIDPSIQIQYPNQDYHRVYFGEILMIRGLDCFSRSQ